MDFYTAEMRIISAQWENLAPKIMVCDLIEYQSVN